MVDTNVVATAEGLHPGAAARCRLACAEALQQVMAPGGRVFLDDGDLILAEYLGAVGAGQPEAGGAFVRWLLQHQWSADKVTRVAITPRRGGPTGFHELSAPRGGVRYDPSDEKFLAVAAAHADHPPVLQALDSKWWGWRASLEADGVTLHFLCPTAIRTAHARKMRG